MKLHEYLKKMRTTCGYTQQNIADLIGLDRSAYAYYETGKISPSLETLVTLSRLYNISVDEMLGNPPVSNSTAVKLSSPDITEEKEEELEKFRTLSRDEQLIILAYRSFSDKQKFLDLLKDQTAHEQEEN